MNVVRLSIGVKTIALSFEDFYRREYPRVYRAAWLLARNEEDALEATQEAFGRALARWRRLRSAEWAAGWVISTALNFLRRRRHLASLADAPEPIVSGPSANAVDLRRALLRLPARQRQAIVLFYVGDLTVHGVGDLMGISDGAVKAHLSQGRAALRTHLEIRHV